jgi:carbamoyl-phosphate synthase large subunit
MCTYIEPITWQTVEKIIAKERPDAHSAHHGWPNRAELRAWISGTHGVLDKYKRRADRRQPRGH